MTRTHRPATHLFVTAAAAALVLSACGTERTISTSGDTGAAPPAEQIEIAAPTPSRPTTPNSTEPTTTTTTLPTELSSTPSSTATTSTTPPPTAPPEQGSDDGSSDDTDPAPCGTFGQLPPRPDSMPTRLWDTDGDDAADDAVTVYGATEGFRVRVVENGIVSEAEVPPVDGFAAQIEPVADADGDHPRVHDLDTDRVFEFATNSTGCVELVSTVEPSPPAGPAETFDLATTPITAPPAEPIDGPCGPILPLGDDVTIATDEFHDYFADGSAEQTITYVRDGQWYLRVVHDHGPVEIAIDDVGPGYVDVLGLADVNHEAGGSEVMVRIGSTPSHVNVGVFTFLEGGCLFPLRWPDESPFTFLVGATITAGVGAICHDGEIELTSYREDADAPGTYLEGWAAFHGVDHLHMGYLPASDGFAEGLTIDEVVPAEFDCNGLPL